jgi:hypothetical protein
MIDGSNCAAECYVLGGSCVSWWKGTCNPDSAPFTYYCSNTTLSGWCTCGSSGGGCFLAGTEITLADGTSKHVEEIAAGDLVLAYDEASGEMKPDAVRAVHQPIEADSYLLVNHLLRLTPTHPVLSDGEWVEIGDLEVGDTLTATDGSAVKIESIQVVPERVTVYNFEVNPYGTYVANGIVVHNKKEQVKEIEPEGEGP